jgi:putative hemolysin
MTRRTTTYCLLVMLAALVVGCNLVKIGNTENSTITPNGSSITQTEKLYPQVRGFDIKYCEGLGYTYEYRQDQNGTYRGYCRLTRDVECLSEDFADGLCHREHSLCEIKGHLLRIMVNQLGNTTETYPICIFPDNSYCRESDFFNRKCYVQW